LLSIAEPDSEISYAYKKNVIKVCFNLLADFRRTQNINIISEGNRIDQGRKRIKTSAAFRTGRIVGLNYLRYNDDIISEV